MHVIENIDFKINIMSGNRQKGLENALNELDKKQKPMMNDTVGINQIEQPKKKSRDWFRLFFRGCLSLFVAFTIGGFGVGIIEVGTDSTIEFGSMLVIGIISSFTIAFWVLFTFIGPYKTD